MSLILPHRRYDHCVTTSRVAETLLWVVSRCSAPFYCLSWFNGCKVKQMQLWCFIKIHLCTTRHYTSATPKDMHKHFTEICACTAQHCFSSFFPPHLTFLLLRGFTLVAVVMEECHISLWLSLWGLHSVSSNLSNCIFLSSVFLFFSFLIKLTNNKRAGADRKSMRLGQPCGLRRRPDTDAFYALDDEAKWAPSHGSQVKQKASEQSASEGWSGIRCSGADSHHCAILVIRQKTDAI